MLHLVECMKRCRVDFGRTGRTRTLILVYFWNWKCCCLVSVYLFWCTFEFGCVIARLRLSQLHTRVLYICNHTPMATAHDSGLISISVEYTTHCYLDFGRTARTFICFGAHSNLDVLMLGCLRWLQFHTRVPLYIPMATAHDSGLICNYAAMATIHGSGLILIFVSAK